MYYTTVVRVVREGGSQGLPGVRVSLYDRDRFSKDDILGSGDTDAAGEVRIQFNADQFRDIEDQVESLRGSFPDLYAVVHAPDGSNAVTTRAEAIDNLPRRSITVTVPAAVAQQHGWASAGS